MINGHDNKIKEKSFFSLKKNKTNIDIEIIFNCEPKLSDEKITENKSNISVLDNKENSRNCCGLIISLLFSKMCTIEFKW